MPAPRSKSGGNTIGNYTLETAIDRLVFDADSGRLIGMVPKASPEADLVVSRPDHPAFVLQYLDDSRAYRAADSHSASTVEVMLQDDNGWQTLIAAYHEVGGMALDVVLQVRASKQDEASRWSVSVRNGAGIRIVDVQFPFVVVPNEGLIVLPAGHGGHLITGAALQDLPPDELRAWQIIPENGNSSHYPGGIFAQFLAWYNECGGLYMACDDTEGNVKLLKPLRRDEGTRLGIAHVGDWPQEGERELEYDVLLRSFTGDWYDAADLYRGWTLEQDWASAIRERSDVPQWLLDSPPHITIRLQGHVDAGPAQPIEKFLPYEKCVPLLEGIAERVDSDLVAVLMSWERGGPWVYPDCFPPAGGEESMQHFVQMARERGWHVGSFCNGTRWVLRHLYNSYDGREYFEEHDGKQSVCRRHDGGLWKEIWDANWRPSYICCMAQELTRDIAVDFVRHLIDWGMESIQFFDQNCNAATFPCFGEDHGHPPVPGKWMATAMEEMIAAFNQAAEEAGEESVIQSTENPCNEYCLPLFHQSDVRLSVPGCGQLDFIPLYHFLFHECTIMHGMMSIGPEPYALPTRTAWGCVWGEIPGAVMTGDGTLLNRETWNWAEWEPKVGSNEDALEMIRTVTALRRGPGREFLVHGRMQRPAVVDADLMRWEWDERTRELPAIAHGAWRAPDSRHGVVLANWARAERTARICDPRLGDSAHIHVSGRTMQTSTAEATDGEIEVALPALSCALVTEA